MTSRTITLLALAAATCTLQAQVVINVDAQQQGAEISPTHYGIFFEDINHAADGGLYAELIRNRSFEDDTMPSNNRRNNQENGKDHISSWYAVGNARLTLIQHNLLNNAQRNALNVQFSAPGDGVKNEGFWGMNVVAGRKYKLSFFAKSDQGYKGILKAQFIDTQGKILGSSNIKVKAIGKWTKYTATINATGNDPKAQFALVTDKAGSLQFDVVSLFPPTFKNRPNGMRPDLAQMLADMHPRFMRFPGGCFVEGKDSPDNAFRWKRTIGPIEEREGHPNLIWGYRTTDGIGFHEYLQLSEDIGAKPLYVVNVGIWHGGFDPHDKIDNWIQECLDALEYANGDVTTTYGKLRAKNGHPKPFGLEYIEIGNENYNVNVADNSDMSDHYPERYIQFYNAIKARYPNVKCIGNVEAWGTDNPSWRNNHPVEIVDEHYYRNPKWFAERFHRYDSYPRDSYKVYVGEYAVTSQCGEIGNLNAALGEAVYMMGMENNSDVVIMNSYAPIFVNENDTRWKPDMIRFNSHQCMGTPSYYVQKLFPNNIGTRVLKTDCTWKLTQQNASNQEENFQVGLGSWNTAVHYRNPKLIVDGKETPLGDFNNWNVQSGTWKMENEHYVQRSSQEPAISLCPQQIHAKKYSFKVQAMKESGNEGFLMLVGYAGKNRYQWYNVAGWNNKHNGVEQETSEGGKIRITDQKPFHVETNRWYDLQVDVDGDSLHCYIDNQLDFVCKQKKVGMMEGVFATTTIDETKKIMYVKVVNVGKGNAPGILNLKNCKINTTTRNAVTLTQLTSANGTDENTLDHPKNIYPRTTELQCATSNNSVEFTVAPFSVNILKIKLK